MRFSVSLFFLQWAIGGLFFLYITTRHRLVGLGYGWLLRVTYIIFVGIALLAGFSRQSVWLNYVSLAVITLSGLALAFSFIKRSAGVSGQEMLAEDRSSRVAEMTGIEREAKTKDGNIKEFNPVMDLIPPLVGLVGLVLVGIFENTLLDVSRIVIGALFMGAVTDAMLLGHWYLVQPGLKRGPLKELVKACWILVVPEVVLLLLPTGMVSVITGEIDDGYAGLLGWFWIACVVTTIGLFVMTVASLKEKQYSAVMAATGLLYLAILTAFGIDLVARALLV